MKFQITQITIMTLIIFFILNTTLPFTNLSAQNGKDSIVIYKSPEGTNIPVDANIEVVFREKMNQEETRLAFIINPETRGDFIWLRENLTFDPSGPLAYKTTYVVTITTVAKTLMGENLKENVSWTFTTVAETTKKNNDDSLTDWGTWEPIVTGLTIVATAAIGFVGYWGLKRRRSQLRKYIGRLDEIYEENRKDPYVCEHKLMQLKESLKIKFRRGLMEENHYLIMDKRSMIIFLNSGTEKH